MKIAVDAMGGDNAPKAIIDGVLKARDAFSDLEFLVYGDKAQVEPLIDDFQRIELIHASEKITGDDEPVRAIRRKKDSSMVLAAQAVKKGDAQAVFSAGNTGALLAAGLFIVGRMQGIERPGLLSTLPTMDEKALGFDMLDLGANAENRAEHLHQYGILGALYAQQVRKIDQPRVALLNNGTEATKGNDVTKEAYQLLAAEKRLHFIGNLEARELMSSKADVVVSDGFTGNAVLKTIEGTAGAIVDYLKTAIYDGGSRAKVGAVLLKPVLSQLKERMDYSAYGGAVLIGLKAPVVKTHGSTNAEGVYSTIRQIRQMLAANLIGNLTHTLEAVEDEPSK